MFRHFVISTFRPPTLHPSGREQHGDQVGESDWTVSSICDIYWNSDGCLSPGNGMEKYSNFHFCQVVDKDFNVIKETIDRSD